MKEKQERILKVLHVIDCVLIVLVLIVDIRNKLNEKHGNDKKEDDIFAE